MDIDDIFNTEGQKPSPVDTAFVVRAQIKGRSNVFSAESLRRLERCLEIVDHYIDRPQEEKDALKAVIVLNSGPPFMYTPNAQLIRECGPLTDGIIKELVRGQMSPNLSQYVMTMATEASENVVNQLRRPDMLAAIDHDEMLEMAGELEPSLRDIRRHGEMAKAPRLEALALKTIGDTLHFLRTAKAPKAPGGPQP